jgi:Zn-dependent protease
MMVSMSLTVIVIIVFVILLSMTLHEAMHAFTSYWLGDDTARLQGRLTLNPLAHIDPIGTLLIPGSLIALSIISGTQLPIFGAAKPVPFNPSRVRYGEYGAALVGLAGPLTNLLFAVISGLTLRFISVDIEIVKVILTTFFAVNLGFFVFNMLPVPPLDGSRVLYAIAPRPLRDLMNVIEQQGLVFIFIIIFFFSNQIGALVGGVINALSQIIIGQTLF